VTMQIPQDAVLLRIFFGEDEKFGQLPLYEAIVLKAMAKERIRLARRRIGSDATHPPRPLNP